MLFPNTFGMLSSKGGNNKSGEPTFSPPRKVTCAVVRVMSGSAPTSVRTDSSASRGHAREMIAAGHILFPPKTIIADGDKFEIANIPLRVVSIQPRFDLYGKIDHLDVVLDHWKTD